MGTGPFFSGVIAKLSITPKSLPPRLERSAALSITPPRASWKLMECWKRWLQGVGVGVMKSGRSSPTNTPTPMTTPAALQRIILVLG
jgi:hypothetical protein